MTVGFNTVFKKENNIYFIIKNVSLQRKSVNIFGRTIPYNNEYDLLTLPEVSESDIRHSLVKGVLFKKIKNLDIVITGSNIDLLQFSQSQLDFLASAGLTMGGTVDGSATGVIATEETLQKIAPAANGVIVDYSGGDVSFASPGVQVFIISEGTLKYDDDGGNTAQTLSTIPAGAITPWRIIKIYQIGTSAELVAIY